MALHHFSKGFGSVVGSYIPITFGDKVVSVTVGLSLFKALNNMGRCVTACFWPDDVNFDRSKLNVGSSYANYAKAVTSSGSATTFSVTTNNNKFIYVNTNTIPDGKIEQITFTFNSSEIRANRIFFALLSTADTRLPDDYEDFYKGSLSIDCNTNGELYYREGDVTEIGNMIEADDPLAGSIKTNISVIHQGDENENENEITDNEKMIYCSNISYRTWSEPKGDYSVTTSTFSSKYRPSFVDGGESYKELTGFTENSTIKIKINGTTHDVKPYIRNTKNNFISDYHIPEGRLKDVVFDRPEMPEYYGTGNIKETYLPEPRWVFKRSRIKFTIPPARKNGVLETRDVYIRYKVVTTIFNDSNNEYDGDWKECKYSKNNNGKDVNIVICPRDEGVLDNMAFRVVFSRSVGNARNYSTDTYYYFHTYQKPTLNIAYPKIIRNKSTDLNGGKGFKYAKILTSNMYSNFDGENAIVNKYVCDALNVILATPQNDNSGIPQFVRFHLAEHKYGRTGLIKDGTPQWQDKTNMQALYRSDNSNDYAKLQNILDNSNDYKTAYMTSIYSNDGQPLLLSGRFTNKLLSDVGQEYKLWTYRTWDYVDSNIVNGKDVPVGNAWPITSTEHYDNPDDTSTYGIEKRYKYANDGSLSILIDPSNSEEWKAGHSKSKLLTSNVVGDHLGMSKTTEYWPDGKAKNISQEPSNVILFRAGYIYLLRARMFHGAAAGAIGSKYSLKNPITYGKYGTGLYDYSEAVNYGGAYPYFPNNSDPDLNLDDIAQHGELNPFTQKTKNANGDIVYGTRWHGPDDGTSGVSLSSNQLNQTYPGFSEVDYTIIEPICPYTSRSNMITVHPTCPEIGANQWITFNYRHLAKNIGAIDSFNADGSKSLVFGKRAGGCHNTISRIMSVYTTCIETILTKYRQYSQNIKSFYSPITSSHSATGDECRDPQVTAERISIWLEPVTYRLVQDGNGNEYKESMWKNCNTPQVYRHSIVNKTMADIANDEFYCQSYPYVVITKNENGENVENVYYSESGLYAFNQYRLGLNSSNKDSYIYEYGSRNYGNWAESQIIWRQCKTPGSDTLFMNANEPMGNSYRWQPVINAMTSNISEIQIENNSEVMTAAKAYPVSNASVQKDNTFSSSDIAPLHTRYSGNETVDYDLQTKYAYNDDTNITPPNYPIDKVSDYPNGWNWGNTSSRRFTINEFAGATDGGVQSPGYSVMYTTISRTTKKTYHNSGNFKFFATALQVTENYGEFFRRVPTSQDCENGNVTTFNGTSNVDLPNVGNLGAKGSYDINTIDNASGNANSNNASPIVRTTHYLYFKTWINTTFFMQVEATVNNYSCNGYETTEDGDEIHLGDSYEDTQSGIFMFDGKQMHLIQKNATHWITPEGEDAEPYEVVDNLDDMITYLSMPDNYRTPTDDQLTRSRYNAYYGGTLNRIDKLIAAPNTAYRIKFGNDQGLTEVYAEDNYGWGRCLSADDISARKVKYDGTIGNPTPSGGIEVPVLVRYTPLLQPKLVSETCHDDNTGKNIVCESGNKNITVLKNSHTKKSQFEFANGNANSTHIETVLTEEFDLNVCYPFIAEDNTYDTKSPNGGLANIYYGDYHFDTDSFPANSPEGIANSLEPKNMDFLGGYGICTAYSVILVPSDPNIDSAVSKGIINNFEKNHYFNNTDKHWNYYKQYANYYKDGSIFKIRSKSVSKAGPVLVAYNVQPKTSIGGITNALSYLEDGKSCPSSWTSSSIKSVKGRNFQSIKFNINNVTNSKGKILYENENSPISFSTFKTKTGINLSSENRLQPGLIYDLLIIPIYSNLTVTKHDYTSGAGTLNSLPYGGGITDSGKNVHLAGSNPLVLFNYLQYSYDVDIDGGSGGGGGTPPPPPPEDPDLPDDGKIWNSQCAIIYPNVDNDLYNVDNGTIKECPGFWLNNSFKLVVRMPSYRTLNTMYADSDSDTIENASHGILDSTLGDTANDFLFEDIQVHIGKINELTEYGYPDEQHLNLNKLTSKEDLAKAHIISYKHYKYSGVFSKKLSDNADTEETDTRELLTAGALNPSDANYKNRFIEINLSNTQIWDETKNRMVPIYTKYPEGYYIQVRYKTAYASGSDVTQWSAWYGGSCDGGKTWWGDKGLGYYIPTRNYTDIHTDFRNFVKESYPGANVLVGKGSYMPFGDIDTNANNNPKDALNNQYYHVGTGNQSTKANVTLTSDTQLVPDNYKVVVDETLNNTTMRNLLGKTINLSANHDNPYENEILYMVKHDKNFSIPQNTSNLHQHMWEMLYIDYIVRNMCKLYYKPKYNDTSLKFNNNLHYHLSVPYVNGLPLVLNWKTCMWDDTEYHLFNTSESIKQYKGLNNEVSINENKASSDTEINGNRLKGPNTLSTSINGINNISNRERWNRNKYYRRVITKNDFDELNSHLTDLVEYIRHNSLSGSTTTNINDPVFGTKDVLPCAPSELEFNRSRKMLIGHTVDASPGLTSNNNINHTLMSSNYLKNIWKNISAVCRTGSLISIDDTKTSI